MDENNGLQYLIDLQTTDQRISHLRDQVKRLPARLQELEDKRQQSAQELERAQQWLEDHGKLRRSHEGEVAALQEKLSRFKTQLMDVKTNREYQAMLHEISATEDEIGRNEDQILEAMLASDEHKAELQRVEQQVQAVEAELAEQRRELEAFSEEAEAEIETLVRHRLDLKRQIPEELKELYDRIASARGLALAEARDQSCQVCHVRLRPQLFTEVKSGQRIITCENCNRILYFVRPRGGTAEGHGDDSASPVEAADEG